MRRLIFIFISLLGCLAAQAEILNPVHWTFSDRRFSDDVFEVSFTAHIDSGWHLYALTLPADAPVNPTAITFDAADKVSFLSDLTPSRAPHDAYDENFEMHLPYYADSLRIVRRVKVSDATTLSGRIAYQCCNDMSCIPPATERFTFRLAPRITASATNVTPTSPIAVTTPDTTSSTLPATPTTTPTTTLTTIPTTATETSVSSLPSTWDAVDESLLSETVPTTSHSLWFVFLVGLLGGFAALLTPCVWPVIPMTLSFFLHRRGGRRDAVLYGVSIVLIYTLIGMLVTWIWGAGRLNELSTGAPFNLFCFLLLLLFGASFLGAFELVLPSSWTTRLDASAERATGFLSILLMAGTLALVSFSCTGPIIGTVLVSLSDQGAFWMPFMAMLGFAVALAIPFTFFALFPTWIQSLPKSGSWLSTLKVSLGFLELAFSLKFFSVADLAYGWHLLDREVFFSLWIVLFALWGLFLLGKLPLHGSSVPTSLPIVRFFGGWAVLAFAVYLVPGLWGAPCRAVSAFAPPLSTQDFSLSASAVTLYDDYDQALAAARRADKPLLVDFSGYGCTNCRKMEAAVMTLPDIEQTLSDRFVMARLMTDDRTTLPTPWTVSLPDDDITLSTVGEKWAFLQRHKFHANAQPFLVILSPDGTLLVPPMGLTEDPAEFRAFLSRGISAFPAH